MDEQRLLVHLPNPGAHMGGVKLTAMGINLASHSFAALLLALGPNAAAPVGQDPKPGEPFGNWMESREPAVLWSGLGTPLHGDGSYRPRADQLAGVHGRVVDEQGKGLAGVELLVDGWFRSRSKPHVNGPVQRAGKVATDEEGRFVLEFDPALSRPAYSYLALSLGAPGRIHLRLKHIRMYAGVDAYLGELLLPRGEALDVLVLDHMGEPVEAAELLLLQFAQPWDTLFSRRLARTDSHGRASSTEAWPGFTLGSHPLHRLVVRTQYNLEPLGSPTEQEAGEPARMFEVRLPQPTVAQGAVSGAPLEIYARLRADTPEVFEGIYHPLVLRELYGLPDLAYVGDWSGGPLIEDQVDLQSVPPEHSPKRSADQAHSPAPPRDPLFVQVIDRGGKPVPNVLFLDSRSQPLFTDRDGRVTVQQHGGRYFSVWPQSPLVSGAYWRFSSVKSGSKSQATYLFSNSGNSVELAWHRPLSLEGRVWLKGVPLAGAVVNMGGEVENSLPPTGCDGRFRMARCSGGEYELFISHLDWQHPFYLRGSLPQATGPLDIHIERVELTGYLQDDAGRPLAGYRVHCGQPKGFPWERDFPSFWGGLGPDKDRFNPVAQLRARVGRGPAPIVTDAQGRFLLRGLHPDVEISLWASHPTAPRFELVRRTPGLRAEAQEFVWVR